MRYKVTMERIYKDHVTIEVDGITAADAEGRAHNPHVIVRSIKENPPIFTGPNVTHKVVSVIEQEPK
jgi:hypothetical protein